jgi:hypothetical protein
VGIAVVDSPATNIGYPYGYGPDDADRPVRRPRAMAVQG